MLNYSEIHQYLSFFREFDSIKNMPEWQSVLESADSLAETMEAFVGEQGKDRLLEEKDYQAITDAYRRLSDALFAFDGSLKAFKTDGKTVPTTIRNFTDTVSEMIGSDMSALLEAPQKSGITLSGLMENSRTQVVDITGKEKKTVGAAMSSRLMVETVINGKPVRGFFTAETKRDPDGAYQNIVRNLSEKYPLYKDFFQNMTGPSPTPGSVGMNAIGAFYGLEFSMNSDIGEKVLRGFRSTNTPGLETLQSVYRKYGKDPEFALAMNEAAKAFKSLRLSEIINRSTLNMEIGDNIDKRNCAMSAVAELLGCGNVLAKSVKMQIKDGDTVQNGTFMAFAEGYERSDMSLDNPRLHADEKAYTGNEGWCSMSQMQCVDIICGNIDRHADNLFYNYKKTGDGFLLNGGQGIDNDSSFTLFVPKDAEDGQNKMPSLRALRVIDERTAAMLSALTPGVLKTVLRAYDIPEKAIDACIKRTEMLQDAVQAFKESGKDLSDKSILSTLCADPNKPMIAVVKQEDWKKLTLDDLTLLDPSAEYSDKNPRMQNVFSNVSKLRSDPIALLNHARKDEKEKAMDLGLRARTHLNASVAYLKVFSDKLSKASSLFSNSPDYNSIRTTIKEALAQYKTIPNTRFPAREDLDKVGTLLQNVRNSADKYVKYVQGKDSKEIDEKTVRKEKAVRELLGYLDSRNKVNGESFSAFDKSQQKYYDLGKSIEDYPKVHGNMTKESIADEVGKDLEEEPKHLSVQQEKTRSFERQAEKTEDEIGRTV